MTPLYQSRQYSWVMLIVIPALLVYIGVAGHGDPEGGAPWWIYPVMLLTLIAFGSMTVTVTYEEVRIRCPLGWPRRRVPIARISACTPFQRKWFSILDTGIRPARGEFRMNGRRGVVLTLDSGLPVIVSAPNPDELRRAVEKARDRLPKHGGA
ncbi:MAG: hypothetical protein Q7W56_12430 [Candidatus Latescibacteria bacterium]|nr:hypothetical protein [Candidatus Latescibacterota bacterium]